MDNRVSLTIKRIYRRRRRKGSAPVSVRRRSKCLRAAQITLLLAVGLAVCFISLLELRLRPVVEQLAVRQVNNHVTARLNAALSGIETGSGELVNIQRDADGSITAVTGDMERVNQIRGQVVQVALDTIAAIDVHTLGVPLGSLFDFDLLWAKGPVVEVHSLVAGTVTADVRSEFRSAGINQTLHRVLLDVEAPLTVLLPGSRGTTVVQVTVCVAETVIVGKVPQTYLNMAGGETNGTQTGSAAAAAGAGAGGL